MDSACDLFTVHLCACFICSLNDWAATIPIHYTGETNATDLPNRGDWIAAVTAPEVEP